MNFTVVPDPKVEAIFRKMWQKDSARFGQIEKKLLELIGKPGDRQAALKNRLRDTGACTSGIIS
jgi:hypothetical protein